MTRSSMDSPLGAPLLDRARADYVAGSHSVWLREEFAGRVERAIASVASPAERLELQAVLAAVRLAKRDRDAAVAALAPFFVGTLGGLRVNHAALEALRRDHPPHLAGWWRLHVSRFLYLNLRLQDAEAQAQRAVRELGGIVEESLLGFLLRCEARLLLARLQFLIKRQDEAEDLVRHAAERLMARYGEAGGVNVFLARAHGLWAYFDWVRGRFNEGRRKVYFALHLLRPPLQDDLTRASILFTAGRLEAIESPLNLELQVQLLQESTSLYRQHHHPLQWRTRVQEAQCFVKGEQLERARALLAGVDGELTERAAEAERRGVPVPPEERDAAADIRLTRVWIHERYGEWAAALRETEALQAEAAGGRDLPRRLQIEAVLHRGLALLEHPGRVDEAHTEIRRALEMAVAESRERIQIRAHLALADTLPDWKEARRHYVLGSTLLSRFPGRFLPGLQRKLAQKFKTLAFEIELNTTPRDAIQKMKQTYAELVFGGAESVMEIQNLTGLSRAQAYRILNEVRSGKLAD